ncbi:MAG TPA: OmpA family protein [Thermoanaerobaculia bacterium]|nr:OmpA family protein [Thermoanaerobaculia bacterium]
MRRAAIGLLLCLAPAAAFAGTQANAPTVTGETGLFSLFTGQTIPQGNWSFGLYYNNWDHLIDIGGQPLATNDELSFDWHRLSASFGYGLTDNLEVSVMLPYEKLDFDEGDLPIGGLDGEGLGNARIGAKWRLSGEPAGDSAFAINAFLEAPTGNRDVANRKVGVGVGLDWSYENWVLNVGYRDPREDDDNVDTMPKEFRAGIGYAGSVSDRLDWITEVVGLHYDGDGLIPKNAYDLTSGGRLWLGEDQEWAFNFALRTDLAQLDSIDEHCPLGGLVGLTYLPGFRSRPEPEPEVVPPPPPPPVEPPPPPPPVVEPPPPPPPAAPAPKPEERITVNFTPGSARLSNIAKAKLDEVALKMKQDPDLRAQVIGYTDPSGSADANQRISEQRAQAVKNYLVTRHGIDPSRITTEGRGSAESTGNAAEDRRAVVILTVQ